MTQEYKDQAGGSNADPSRKCIMVKDYNAQFPDPISVNAGEVFHVSDKVEPWNNNPDWLWVWCTNQRGKSGWVPKDIIVFNADGVSGTVRDPYDATELSVAIGEELVAHQEAAGWFWCTNRAGKSGWVPLDNITFA